MTALGSNSFYDRIYNWNWIEIKWHYIRSYEAEEIYFCPLVLAVFKYLFLFWDLHHHRTCVIFHTNVSIFGLQQTAYWLEIKWPLHSLGYRIKQVLACVYGGGRRYLFMFPQFMLMSQMLQSLQSYTVCKCMWRRTETVCGLVNNQTKLQIINLHYVPQWLLQSIWLFT